MKHLQNYVQGAMLALATCAFYTMIAAEAHAGAGTAICNLINQQVYAGMLAAAIGTIGVLIVGISAALGRISGTMAVTVAVGIAAMVNASSIAGGLGAGC